MKRALVLLLSAAACGRTPNIETPVQPVRPEPPGQQQQQPLRGCEGQSVVALERRTLQRIDAAGTTPLFEFGAGLPADEVSVSQWDVAGPFIGAVAYVAGSWEYLLMRGDGRVVFHARKSELYSPHLFLGADGSLAVAVESSFLVRPDGAVTELGGLMPMTPLLPSGELVVARGKSWEPASQKGVWKDGVFRALTASLAGYPSPTVVGSRVLDVEPGALVSVLDGVRIPLPGPGFTLAQHAGGRFVLLSGETPAQALLVDLETRTVRALANLPSLQERYSWWSAGLQSDGTVLAGVARADQLQAQKTSDLGATWTDVGQPMAMGEDFGLGRWLFALEKKGTVLALSMSTGYGHYVNEVQLISAAGAHRLPTGGLYVNVDLSPGAADLSADGQCAASWVQTAGRDEPHDLVFMDTAGKRRTVKTSLDPAWLRFLPGA